MKIIRVPAVTFLVFELLRRDLLTQEQLRKRLPQANGNQVSAALSHLVKHRAVAFLADEVTTLYYATPDTDNRVYTREESPTGVTKRRRKSKVIVSPSTN